MNFLVITLLIFQFSSLPFANKVPASADVAVSDKSSPNLEDVQEKLYGRIANLFVEAFSKNVNSSENLTDVLDFSSTSSDKFAKFIYKCGLPEFKNWGMPFAEVAARFAILPISQNFCRLPLSLIVQVYGYTIATFLLSEHLLNESNYEELASALTESFEDSAKGIDSCLIDSKTRVLCKGIANFLNSFIKMNGGKGWRLVMSSTDQYGLKAVTDDTD
ncbi:uncharacterized protein TNCT_572781 [Trichonephila clavata]|uniref:Uncharacterized protein n=1 Tax=Trichonephila clavata TaxID=2740835 RepID=A0A8X6JPP3_TRICU|nr:uncharacterized protein TNCT_572781 [Trichonephila clavata]